MDSLVCDLPSIDVDPLVSDLIKYDKYSLMLEKVSGHKIGMKKSHNIVTDNTVRSIQRLPSIKSHTSYYIGKMYIKWIEKHFKSVIRTRETDNIVHFYFLKFYRPLLTMERIDEVYDIDRVKFHIIGGFLTKTIDTGWLEFRRVAHGKYILSSINEFIPALPWYLYRFTQAAIHAYVMKSFSKHLEKIKS